MSKTIYSTTTKQQIRPTITMKLAAIVTTILSATAAVVSASNVHIDVTKLPTDCPIKSQKGDMLSMQ